jgi:hypothetical protein
VEQEPFRRFVRLAVVASILVVAVAGWSQFRLKAVRAEIDALASETSALVSENDALRTQVSSREVVRQQLRAGGIAVRLTGEGAGDARATAYLDEAGRRALLVVEGLKVDASCAYQLRIVPADAPHLLITFGVDPEGDVDLLLDEMPARVEELRIERGGSAETFLSGRVSTSSVPIRERP